MILIKEPQNKWMFDINHSYINLDEDQEKSVIANFQNKKVENPTIFNGEGFAFNKIEFNEASISVNINITDYQRNLWIKDQKRKIAGLMLLGTGAYIYDDEYVYFLQRSKTVAHPNKISTVVGTIDYDDKITSKDFFSYIRLCTLHEIEEEVLLENIPKIKDLYYLGALFNEEDSVLRFRYGFKGRILDVKNDENTGVISVKRKDLKDFTNKNKDNLIISDYSFLSGYTLPG